MRRIQSSMDAIVAGNRQRAISKTVIKGGEAGRALAKAARLSTDVTPGMVEVDGEQVTVFILGLHPMTNNYYIP